MHIRTSFFSALRTAAVVTLVSGAATLGLQAQQSAGVAQPAFAPQSVSVAALPLLALNDAPADLATGDSSSSLNYSSSAGAAETEAAEGFNPGGDAAPQPPPRRYGRRPVYADSRHNADGSNKYGFLAGGGFTLPTGGTHNYLKTGYDFQVGAIRNFNKKFGVALEFNWHNFGIQTNTLNDQLDLYNNGLGAEDQNGDALSSLGGSSHVWSFTLDPTYTYYQGDKYGAYVVGGVGFYHKSTVFTTPATGEYCDEFYGCYEYEANQPIDDYTSNAFGVEGGAGFTYKPSRFGDIKFYGEARYVYMANSQRTGFSGSDYVNDAAGLATYTGNNFFPQNSDKTTYIPITFGIRF